MSEPTAKDVLAKLDSIEGLLKQLVGLVGDGVTNAKAPRSPAAVPAAAAVTGPAPIRVRPPAKAAVAAAAPAKPAEPAPGAVKAVPATVGGPLVIEHDDGSEVVIPMPSTDATYRDVIQHVFTAATMDNREHAFLVLEQLTHSSQLQGPRAIEHYKAFSWVKLRRNTKAFLAGGDPTSFVIAYTEPREVTKDDDRVKVFVESVDGRMPSPVTLRREASAAGAWRVTQLSL